MKRTYIVSGYKGIMPLDLTHVDPKYHKDLINQHSDDIRDYKIYQNSLKPELQYDNSIQRVLNMLERDKQINQKRNHEYLLKKHQEYMRSIRSRL